MSFMEKVNDFGKKFGQAASDTYKSVSDKSSKLIEEGKYKLKIADKKDEIEKEYLKLGEKIYKLYESGNDMGDYSDDCSKISQIKSEISQLEIKIKYLKGLRDCETCSKEIKSSYKFCPLCGTAQQPISIVLEPEEAKEVEIMEEEQIQVVDNAKVCKTCNNKLPNEAEFCPFCGEKI